MSLALLTKKWRIFKSDLCCKLKNCTNFVVSAMLLHNFYVEERIVRDGGFEPSVIEVFGDTDNGEL